MRLDHLSYACHKSELADVVQRIGSDLGASFIDGGRHPGFGTQNFVLPLQGHCYIEVVAALDHPAADKAPFGRAVQQRADAGGGWLGWVIAVDDLAPIEQRLGRKAVAGRRVRPDGVELTWEQIGVLDLIDDPQLPYFVHWTQDPAQHPAAAAGSISIESVEVNGDPSTVAAWLGEPVEVPLAEITIQWTPFDPEGNPGICAVTFNTASGSVRID